MYWRVFVLFYFLNSCAIENVKGATSSAIPDLLYDCYRRNFTAISKPPFTVKLLIELIRKIELDDRHTFDMRILATSMLHGVALDGIRRSQDHFSNRDEFISIPYRATGEEFYKYKLIVDYLTSGESFLFPAESLSTPELCVLHNMISNSVDPWKRGDESSTCVHQSNMPLELEMIGENDEISTCPIKMGIVNTKWGTISAGYIIAAVASALEETTVTFSRIEDAINNTTNKNVTTGPSYTNNVNNVWVSTIVGDLAAVILNQVTYSPEIGIDGFWNDTLLPHIYYLKSTKWDMTESDILAGIDGLAIASYVKNLSGTVTRIRLSQLIDMYYSDRGIMSNKEFKVTNRTAILNKLLNSINLKEQVVGTVKLLQGIGTYDILLNKQEIDELATNVIEKFKTVAGTITKKYDNVEGVHGPTMKSPIEVLIILDGSYDPYTAQQMILGLSEAIEVSYYGSQIGIINGQSGDWLVNVTGEMFQLFNDLYEASNEWPSTLSLGRSLESAIYYYQNKTTVECMSEIIKPMARAILILTTNTRLTDNDIITSKRAFNSIKNSHPEICFILATTNQDNFQEFTDIFKENDQVLSPLQDVHSFLQDISGALSSIPANIINFYCSQPEHLQDYVTPEIEKLYEIRREYIEEGHITTKFSNSQNGDLSICVFSDSKEAKSCRDITVNGEISFDSEDLCSPDSACNMVFQVYLNATKGLCGGIRDDDFFK